MSHSRLTIAQVIRQLADENRAQAELLALAQRMTDNVGAPEENFSQFYRLTNDIKAAQTRREALDPDHLTQLAEAAEQNERLGTAPQALAQEAASAQHPEQVSSLIWMEQRSDLYSPDTAAPAPLTAALEAFEGGDEEDVTVAQFRASDVVTMLPDNLFGWFLEMLAQSMYEQFPDSCAESEMLDALYYKRGERNPVHAEVEALLRPTFEKWWRTHAAGFGVRAHYASTGLEQTFTVAELRQAQQATS